MPRGLKGGICVAHNRPTRVLRAAAWYLYLKGPSNADNIRAEMRFKTRCNTRYYKEGRLVKDTHFNKNNRQLARLMYADPRFENIGSRHHGLWDLSPSARQHYEEGGGY